VREDPRFAKALEAVGKAPKRPQAFHNPGMRTSTRLAFFGAGGSQQAAISYGAAKWRAPMAKGVESGKFDGKRWRLGVDFWTTFDNNAAMTIGGKAVPPNGYYLSLERTAKGEYLLAFNDAAEVRKLKIDAYQVERTTGGIEVPMKAETVTDVAETLAIDFEVADADQTTGTLVIRFGPYKLSAPYAMKVEI
jgi:hypothetical protein